MAEMSRDGDELVLKLSDFERAESLHGDIRVPMTSVLDVEVLDDVISEAHGLKFPGTRWPGKFMIGTLEHAHAKKSFVVIHKDASKGLRVRLDEDAPFGEFLIGFDDPESVKERIGQTR